MCILAVKYQISQMFFVASDQASPAPKTRLSNPREKDAVNAAAGKAKTLAETTRVFLIPRPRDGAIPTVSG